MSGLFGILRFDGAPVVAEDLGRMAAALASYGEDGGGLWRHEVVGLGCALRAVTAEDAFERQPMVEDALAIVAAARLDNRDELISTLGLPGTEAAVLADGELVRRAFRRWGEACVDRLCGDWSFAAWDRAERKLTLARDHHGNTGLYWHMDSNRLIFASHLKGLLSLADTPRRPDLFKVAQVLVAWPGDGVRTAWEELSALPPAHVLTVWQGQVATRRYWFPEAAEPLRFTRDEDCLEEFLHLYESAVRSRLRSVKPIGALLSAGLDSGSVVALAGPQLAVQGRTLEAFTAVPGFDSPGMNRGSVLENEWDLAHEAAQMAGVERHAPVDAGGRSLLDTLRAHLDIHGAPGHAAPNYGWMLAALSLARDRCLGVVLTGQQGNATVSQKAEASVWWPSLLRGAPGEAWMALRESEPDPWHALKRQVLKPLMLPWLHARRRRQLFPGGNPWTEYSAISPAFAREMDLDARAAAAGFDPAFLSVRGRANLDLLGLGSSTVGATWHELGAAYDLEVRDPTADRRLVEFCVRIPDSQLRRRGEDRLLLRRAFHGRLPVCVLDNPRYGLQSADLGERAAVERASLQAELERLRQQPTAHHCLDLPRMEHLLAQLTPENARERTLELGCILLRGLNAGIFLASSDPARVSETLLVPP